MSTAASPKYWDDYYKQGRDFISVNSQELKKLLSNVPKVAPKTALDIGCGTGQLTRDLYHSGYKVVGIDMSAEALNLARSLTRVGPDELRYIHRDAEKDGLTDLPFTPYGLVTCQSVFAFINDEGGLLANIDKALSPDGVFAIISMLDKNVPPHKKVAAINADQTKSILERHFSVKYYELAGLGYFICAKKSP